MPVRLTVDSLDTRYIPLRTRTNSMNSGIISCRHNEYFERDGICCDCMWLCPAAETISPSNVRALCLNGGPGSAGDARNSDVATRCC